MFKDEKAFVELFEANMPVYDESLGPREELEVFSHNDVQENNFLVIKSDDDKIEEIKVIDFEYTQYNFRGVDLATYITESHIKYSGVESSPWYEHDPASELSEENI